MQMTIKLNDDWIYALARQVADHVLRFVQSRRLAITSPFQVQPYDYRSWRELQSQLSQFSGIDRAYFLASIRTLIKTTRAQQQMHPTAEAWLERVKQNDARFGVPTVITRHGAGKFLKLEVAA